MKGHITRGRGDGVWYLRVELPRGAGGARRQKRITFRGTKAEAQRKLRDVLQKIENGGLSSDTRMSFDDLLTKWMESRSHRLARRTMYSYDIYVRIYLRPAFGALKASAVRPEHIENAIAAWSRRSRLDESAPLSQRTVRHIFDTLRAACRWAVKMRYIEHSPVDRVEPPKFTHRKMIPLDPKAIAELLTAAQGTNLQSPILTIAGTGLRRSEALALQWADINFEKAQLTVNRTLDFSTDGVLRVKAPKTEKSARTISLAPFVVKALRQQRASQLERFLELGIPVRPDGWVFDRPELGDGQPWSPNLFSKAFIRLVKRTNAPTTTIHGLRHAYATIALSAGVDLKTVSETLGHSEIGTTADIYTSVVESLKLAAADRMESAMGFEIGEAVNQGPVPQRCQTTRVRSISNSAKPRRIRVSRPLKP